MLTIICALMLLIIFFSFVQAFLEHYSRRPTESFLYTLKVQISHVFSNSGLCYEEFTGRIDGTRYPRAMDLVADGALWLGVRHVGGKYWHAVPAEEATCYVSEIPDQTDYVGGDARISVGGSFQEHDYRGSVSGRVDCDRSNVHYKANAYVHQDRVSVERTASAAAALNNLIGEMRESKARVDLAAASTMQSGSRIVQGAINAIYAVPPKRRVRSMMHSAATPVWYLRKLAGMSVWDPLEEIPHGSDPDAEQVVGVDHFKPMSQVDAMEATKILNSATDVMGEAESRLVNAADKYKKGIPTGVPPSSPSYPVLTRLLGPLTYQPKVEAHEEAATFRRAALAQASKVLEGAIVGLVSPSNAEVHTFPNAAIWYYDDGAVDRARREKHCTYCKAPTCTVVASADKDSRVLRSNSESTAAKFFSRFSVQSLLLLNIEPNLRSNALLSLMVEANIWNAYSLVSVDWRVMVTGHAEDKLIGMTTRKEAGQIVSSFQDAGDYVQDAHSVAQLFKPTSVAGHALRRTVVFGQDATWYYELNVSSSNVATRCLPDVAKWYFLRIPDPTGVDTILMAERNGFDRVLGTYRTQAIKDLETAKIVLRQSNVTYSIAGTQVTPRLALTNAEFEAMAVWLVVYSEVQDAVAARTRKSLSAPTTASLISTSIWDGVKDRLTATAGGQMALGSYSAVEEALGAYRRNIQEKTINQLSDMVVCEVFGPKLSTVDAAGSLFKKWANVLDWARKAWNARHLITPAAYRTWHLSFGFADLITVSSLLGLRLTVDTLGCLLDVVLFVARVSCSAEAVLRIQRFQQFVNWPTTKAERFWIAAQNAQALEFQAATIDIVQVFYNLFSMDPAAELRDALEYRRQHGELPEDELRAFNILDGQATLPYSDFLSEIKLFLGRFNTRASRYKAVNSLLNAFARDKREARPEQLARMVHTLKSAMEPLAAPVEGEMHFALGDKPTLLPIPFSVQTVDDEVDLRQAFHNRETVNLRPNPDPIAVSRLTVIDGKVDFSPIHRDMEFLHPGGVTNPVNYSSVCPISPDERGAALQKSLLEFGASQNRRVPFTNRETTEVWRRQQLQEPGMIQPVREILEAARSLAEVDASRGWLGHIDGLAMGGKSAGVRSWITNQDLVVVPTKKLRDEWEDALGRMDPLRQASVVTQHKALVTKYTRGYVIIDEAYTMDLPLLQMIANRHRQAKGIITVGDGRQIGNVFTEGLGLDPAPVPLKMVSPVSFVPWDALLVYLAYNQGKVPCYKYYCGSNSCEGLLYTIRANEALVPGEGDLSLTGTQAAKGTMHLRGIPSTITVHEAQGARSEHTIIHGSLTADIRWWSLPEQYGHMGVAITRARRATVFVVDALQDIAQPVGFPWVRPGVNGVLPNDCIYAGTHWDLVDPRVIDEALETYIHEAPLRETTRKDKPLTNPVTIGTVFVDGEAVAKSELRAHVALTSGVKLTDLGIKHSDQFDDYLIQPRDVPGVDQIQALTRAVRKPKPTHADYINAEVIVNRIMDQVLDPKIFFAHLANSKRNVLARRERSQVIDGCYADVETRRSTLSFGFLKPEFAKKQSELSSANGGELKAQGVITASASQQAIFMDACDALTHAWARSMRQGKFSPVGYKEQDIDAVLTTFDSTYELDLEKQDSSHAAVHVLVACRFLELASDKLGLAKLAEEIRTQRTVRMMKDPFTFVLEMALASGDPWTLIFNKIMAVSSLISVANLQQVRMMQTGDDITLDRQPDWDHRERLRAQKSANRGLTWKSEERSQREAGVTFISRGALPNQVVVYKALRTVLKYTARRRTRLQHASYASDTERLLNASAKLGLMAYVEARCRVFGGDPAVVHDMWARAIQLATMPFDDLPDHLRDDNEKPFEILSRDVGCFGFALAHCIGTNVQAINAIASYPRTTSSLDAKKACQDNGVPYVFVHESWAKRSRERLSKAVSDYRIKLNRAFVAIYNDHAVAVKPKELVTHTAKGKMVFRWKTLHVNGLTQYDGL